MDGSHQIDPASGLLRKLIDQIDLPEQRHRCTKGDKQIDVAVGSIRANCGAPKEKRFGHVICPQNRQECLSYYLRQMVDRFGLRNC